MSVLARTVADLEGLRGEDAAAAEGAGLVARDAGLEARLGRGAALLVGDLGLWGKSEVQQELRGDDPANEGDCGQQSTIID